MTITCQAKIAAGAGQYYASLHLTDIKQDNGNPVKVENYLEVSFLSPVPVKKDDIQFTKWDPTFNIVINPHTEISKKEYQIDFVISADNKQAFTIEKDNNIVIGLNSPSGAPDLSKDLSHYTGSIAITADTHPDVDGSVDITCSPAPDSKLDGQSVDLDFTIGSTKKLVSVIPGKSLNRKLLAGEYSITAHDFISNDLNIVVPVMVDQNKIKVDIHQTRKVSITFGKPKRYSSVEFSINEIPELATENFLVTLKVNRDYQHSFATCQNKVTTIYELPDTGKLDISIAPINLNNKEYDFTIDPLTLKNNKNKIKIGKSNVHSKDAGNDAQGNVTVTIKSDSDINGKLTELRLIAENNNYSNLIEVKNNNKQDFPVKVKPGKYKVIANNFIESKTVYVVDAPTEFEVKSGENLLNVRVTASANLAVRGFEQDKLTFGGCTTLESDNFDFFVKAKTYSIFKYAGSGGDGDPDKILDKDYATQNTIALARRLETEFKNVEKGSGHRVLPVMISYTVQLSGGDDAALKDAGKLKNSFANFILTLHTLMQHKDADHLVLGGIIVNPDMLGNCQQHNLHADYPVPVKGPLQAALTAREALIKTIPGVSAVPVVPPEITEDLKGYIQSVNWLISTLAPDVTFGWQINLWGTGSSNWIYGVQQKDGTAVLTAKEVAKKTANFISELGVYSGKHIPDFLAIDRYEADDLTSRSYVNSYCYGPYHWAVYFDFCAAVSAELKLPVMPWQIPASRTPLTTDNVNANFDDQHWGTAANYIFGDPELGSQVENIHQRVRDFSFSQHGASYIAENVGGTPGEVYLHGGGFDVSQPAYRDFPLRGIFHIELGGGSTVGMVPPTGGRGADLSWSNQKLAEYFEHPVKFTDTMRKK